MIKILKIFVALTLLTSINCKAQHLVGFQGYFGAANVNCDSVALNKIVSMEPTYGFGVGYKHLELRNMIGFQGELNYQYSGYSFKDESLYYTQHLKYLSVPLLAHVDFGKHAVKFTFSVGTYANFLIDRSRPETNMELTDSSCVSRIENGKYKTFTYGLTGQIGISFCSKVGVFTVHGRSYIGMSKMVDMGDISLFNYMSERVYCLGLSWMKPFGKGDPYYTKKEKVKKLEEVDPLEVETVPVQTDDSANDGTNLEDEAQPETNEPTKQDLDWEGDRYEDDAPATEEKSEPSESVEPQKD